MWFLYWDDWQNELLEREFSKKQREQLKFSKTDESDSKKIQTSKVCRSVPEHSEMGNHQRGNQDV